MSVGKLREYVAIEQPQETPDTDGLGGIAVFWVPFAFAWARITPVAARTVRAADGNEHRVTHKIRIRELPGLTQKMRVLFEGRTFQIRGVLDPEERDRFHDLLCEEGDGVAS